MSPANSRGFLLFHVDNARLELYYILSREGSGKNKEGKRNEVHS